MKNFKNNKRKIHLYLFPFIVFFVVIFFLQSDYVYIYVNPMPPNSEKLFLFGDWLYVLDSIKCHNQNVDIILNNYCVAGASPFIYGSSLLYLPYAEKFYKFYYYAIPYSTIFFLIFFLNYQLKPKKINEYLIIILIIFSTPVMYGFERMNTELLIFVSLILISYFRNIYIQNIFLLSISAIKYYPIVSYIIILFLRNNFKNFVVFCISILLILVLFYLDRVQILTIKDLSNLGFWTPNIENVGMLIISFFSLAELSKSVALELSIFNAAYIYNFVLTISSMVFFYCLIKFFFLNNPNNDIINFDFNFFEDRLFILSSTLLFAIYFLNMSYVYKEIYLIGILPFLKKNIEIRKFRLIYNIILLKFILLTLMWIMQIVLFDKSIYIKGFNILFKDLLDLFLIFSLLSIVLPILRNKIPEFFLQFRKQKK